MNYWKLLTSPDIISAVSINENLPVRVHIYKKSDFTQIRTIDTDPFFVFHFAHGYSSE